MLDAIGLPVRLEEADRLALREMIYVRNCIVHRAGRADDDSATEMQRPIESNRMIRISQIDMSRFSTASLALASAIPAAVSEREARLNAELG